ncbi:protein DpdE [Actinokineospora sp. NPDC004072]
MAWKAGNMTDRRGRSGTATGFAPTGGEQISWPQEDLDQHCLLSLDDLVGPDTDDAPFAWDSELGWGRVDTGRGVIRFFDSPVTPEVEFPLLGRTCQPGTLSSQERVWWFNGQRWLVGRIDSPQDVAASAYHVHFPNGYTTVVPSAELRVRWSKPISDPIALLVAGTVETRYFHQRRTALVNRVKQQRSHSRNLGGLLSSAVEIHDHQIGAARRVLSDPVPRYLLADEVGLGKTIEAGMVLRQLLLDSPGEALIIVPDKMIGQWKSELRQKFRIQQFPRRVRIAGHSVVDRIKPAPRLLTIVDEAHRLTDAVKHSASGERDERYAALCAIAHQSKALLLLSATPVRSNEIGFLGLLHLLDPANYSLSDIAAFRRRVEMRDELAEVMAELDGDEDTPVRYLVDPLEQIADLLPDDQVVRAAVDRALTAISANQEDRARGELDRVKLHVAEMYRLHRRMIRNRRSAVLKKYFPARGRTHAEDWRITDPDPRRAELLEVFEDLRLQLELAAHPRAGRVLQVVLGRILAPIPALEDLSAALAGATLHDLSPDEEAAVHELRTAGLAEELAAKLERLLAADVAVDRFKAMTTWARKHVGRGKFAIACSHPNTAAAATRRLVHELGAHRVSALLETQDDAERTKQTAEFARNPEKSFLVVDRSAEEGTNLQFIVEVLHLDLPTTTSRIEQRLGRFDRWSEEKHPVRSVVFAEADPDVDHQLSAWTRVLDNVFGAFTSSTSTLQYVLSDVEAEFFEMALTSTLAGAGERVSARAATLDQHRRRIAGQDLLDSIEDRVEDEELADRLSEVDAKAPEFETAIREYLGDVLRIKASFDDDGLLHFRVDRKNPPLLTDRAIGQIAERTFEAKYTADRLTAIEGAGFLRWGEPLVDAFARLAEQDDRGRAFAVEVPTSAGGPDTQPLIFFCFDIAVGPNSLAAGDTAESAAHRRAVHARTAALLPSTIERIWWQPGRGRCDPRLAQKLEHTAGTNLGSRPERFHELTAPYDWKLTCETAYADALAELRRMPGIVRRLADARRRAATTRAREDAILRARSAEPPAGSADQQVADAVDRALADPLFTLESCGAVFITRTPDR